MSTRGVRVIHVASNLLGRTIGRRCVRSLLGFASIDSDHDSKSIIASKLFDREFVIGGRWHELDVCDIRLGAELVVAALFVREVGAADGFESAPVAIRWLRARRRGFVDTRGPRVIAAVVAGEEVRWLSRVWVHAADRVRARSVDVERLFGWRQAVVMTVGELSRSA